MYLHAQTQVCNVAFYRSSDIQCSPLDCSAPEGSQCCASEAAGCYQGLILTIFEPHHIRPSQGTWFAPDFYNFSVGLQGGQTFCLHSGLAPASSELKGPLRIRHFWDESEDLQRILNELETTFTKKRRAQVHLQLFLLMCCDINDCFDQR